MSNNNCCISDILNTIVILQNNCNKVENIQNTCDSPILGRQNSCLSYNTRPLSLYNCTGSVLSFPCSTTYEEEKVVGTSSVLRVEKVEGCSCTCRVLAPNPDQTSPNPYVTTNDFVSINLDCTCAIRCLADTYISCL